MKVIRGKNLFTVRSAGSGKPEIRPEIAQKISKLLESLKDGEVLNVDANGDPDVIIR
jgi:hypothetical protein